MVSLSQENIFHIVKLASWKRGQSQFPIFLLQFPSCSSGQMIVDTKDENTVMRKSVWVDNRNITECQKCRKPFSVERRRMCDGRERSWSEG